MQLTTTITGNLTTDPTLRFTPNGRAVANFTIAHTPRVNVGGEWKDGDTVFLYCVAWGQLAENIAETFGQGSRAIATGTLSPNTWTDKEGNQRTQLQLVVDDMGASVKYRTASIRKPDSEYVRDAKSLEEVAERMQNDGITVTNASDVLTTGEDAATQKTTRTRTRKTSAKQG